MNLSDQHWAKLLVPQIDCAKLGSEVCMKQSEDGVNLYFVPNIHMSLCVL